MARTFDLLASQYGWTDADVLALPLKRIRQAVAAATERLLAADLGRRRLATVQLRTICAYIASTVPYGKDQENPMLNLANSLHLGDGTQDPNAPSVDEALGSTADTPGGPALPGATLTLADLPDAPPAVRVGAPDPNAGEAGNPVDFEQVGNLFGFEGLL